MSLLTAPAAQVRQRRGSSDSNDSVSKVGETVVPSPIGVENEELEKLTQVRMWFSAPFEDEQVIRIAASV